MIRVDLRSDTVTHPTSEMLRAMAEAELGDDVYGDDPTVNRLQDIAAETLGKEAGLFVASGTMSNLVAILAHTQRGDEIIVGDQSHIFNNEAGGASVLGGVSMYPVHTDSHGLIAQESIERAVRPRDYHKPVTRLLCLENTHNQTSGRAITPQDSRRMAQAARDANLSVHLDGARIFNASVALECPVAALTADVDTVGFCLSKGLSCPAGSVLCGDADFIDEARRWRKMVGGGMRQVGVLAAAGIVALERMVDRLAEDHASARQLALGLAEIDGVHLDPQQIQTNIVRFTVPANTGGEVTGRLKKEGILVTGGGSEVRMVTHYGVEPSDIDFTLMAMGKVMSAVA